MKIGLLTSEQLPDLYTDDQILIDAFKKFDVKAVPLVWNSLMTDDELLSFDLLIFLSAWDYHLITTEFVRWLDKLEKLKIKVFNPVKIIRENMDKNYLKVLENKGIKIIETEVLKRGYNYNIKSIMEINGWSISVIKPVVSLSAYETYKFTLEESTNYQEKLAQLLTVSDVLLQKYFEEITTIGETSLVFIGGKYSHAMLKKPKAGDFRVQNDFGGTREATFPEKKIIDQAERIINLYDSKLLYARVDGIVINDKFFLVELEMIDPVLFFAENPEAVDNFVINALK